MKPTNEFDYEAATMDEKVEYWHTHNTGDTLREFLKMSQDEYDAWMVSGKEPGAPLRKAIAIDFDGCLFHTEHMKIVSPNWDVINRSKGEKETGTGLILWTCRAGALLEEAIAAYARCGLEFDAINESLPDWITAFGTTPRKVGATEYWDDKSTRLPDTPADKLQQAKDNWQMCPRCANWRPYGFDSYEPAYCRWCGRPLTDAGWEEWITRTSKLLSGS